VRGVLGFNMPDTDVAEHQIAQSESRRATKGDGLTSFELLRRRRLSLAGFPNGTNGPESAKSAFRLWTDVSHEGGDAIDREPTSVSCGRSR
jgi:hypothetical protein